MPLPLRTLLSDEPGNTKSKIIAIYALLIAFNVATWLWALIAFRDRKSVV